MANNYQRFSIILYKEMESENQMICGNPSHKAYKLKGRKTGKIKYLVVIDEEEQKNPFQTFQEKKRKEIQEFLQSRVSKNKEILSNLGKDSLCLNPQLETNSNLSIAGKKSTKTSGSFPTRRPNTRSRVGFRSASVYRQSNLANIPALIKQNSHEYQQMLFEKVKNLRNREIVYIGCE